ncbi:MAG: serine/threonine-protein kinase [Myxococcota bacterium]
MESFGDEQGTRPGALLAERFLLKRALGQGGAGVVWLAEDRQTSRSVAIKLLHQHLRDNPMTLEKARLEADILLRFRHPNIARAIHAEFDRAPSFLVLEWIEGSTLAQVIGARAASDTPFDVGALLSVAGQLCSAVTYAHSHSVLHRDLKPSNVIITPRGGLQVLDFGVARVLGQSLHDATTHGRMSGSYAYCAPEQARAEHIDERADLFSLGVILYELLTLRRAWAVDAEGGKVLAYSGSVPQIPENSPVGLLERIFRGPRPRPSAVRPELRGAVDEVIQRALAIEAPDRYPSANALWTAFSTAILGLSAGAPDADATQLANPLAHLTVAAGLSTSDPELRALALPEEERRPAPRSGGTEIYRPDEEPELLPTATSPGASAPLDSGSAAPLPRSRAPIFLGAAVGMAVLGLGALGALLPGLLKPVELELPAPSVAPAPAQAPAPSVSAAALATPMPSVSLAPSPSPSPSLAASPKAPARVSSSPNPPASPSPASAAPSSPPPRAAAPPTQLGPRLRAALQAAQGDPAALTALGAEIKRQAEAISDVAKKRNIQMMVDSSVALSDSEGLRGAISALERALE